MDRRAWVGLAALFGFLAVAAGAFAAHGFEASGDSRAAGLVETGARHQMWHALAMIGYLALGRRGGGLPLWLWSGGVALFSGSLYALAFGAPAPMAFAAPVGGAALLLGWAALAWEAVRARP
jgi:uncharacterized membrane protein YgdD (TMEM256/DUF423 family)